MNVEPLTPPGPLGNNTTLGSDSPCFHDNDSFKYNAYTVTYLLVFPVALFFNVGAMLVFLVQLRHKYSASSVVMMNLALSDGSFALTLPLRLAYYFRGGVWDFPDWLCRLCVFGFYVNLYTSILFLTLLSVLRWLAVDKPLHHRSVATPKRVLLVCLGIWAFVGVASTPFLSNGVIHRGGSPRCFEPSSHSSWGRVLILNYVGLVLGFLLPFVTILLCYSHVVRHLSGSDGPRGTCTARRRRRRRAVQLVSMVISTFLLCFLPYHVVRTLHLHAVCGRWACDLRVALQRGVSITLCMAALNSVVDPLLYYYSTSSFRDTARAAHTRLLSSRGSSLRRSRAAD